MNLNFTQSKGKKIQKEIFLDVLSSLKKHIPAIHETEVELLLTDNESIRKLNKEFRGIDKPTDVLSFANREVKQSIPSQSLGQIIISLERASQQADEIGQSFEQELQFLFAHGLLHLLGYDHQNKRDEQKMLAKTNEILGR